MYSVQFDSCILLARPNVTFQIVLLYFHRRISITAEVEAVAGVVLRSSNATNMKVVPLHSPDLWHSIGVGHVTMVAVLKDEYSRCFPKRKHEQSDLSSQLRASTSITCSSVMHDVAAADLISTVRRRISSKVIPLRCPESGEQNGTTHVSVA